MEALFKTPSKMLIANVNTADSIEALFNPTSFVESLDVNYSRHTIPGLSHQRLQYVNTNNVSIPLTLFFDSLVQGVNQEQIKNYKRFLQHLCYPKQGEDTVAGGGPPRVLFLWPNLIRLTCVVTSLSFDHQSFNVEADVSRFTATLTLEEIRDKKLFSEDLLAKGSFRSEVSPEVV